MEFRFSLLFTFVSFYLEYSHTAWLEIEFSMMVKNPPTVQETRVQSLHWEDPLEEGMATHSSILAWRGHGNPLQYSGLENPYGQRSLAGYKSMGSQSQTRLSN